MTTRKIPAALAATGVCLALAIAMETPAVAATAVGVADGFIAQCDASVYISDDLIGSPGKIEAWGGYVCPSSYRFIGQLKVTLKKGNAQAAKFAKNVNGSSDHVDATTTNISGRQKWSADLWIFRPGFDATIVSTGVINS